MINTNSFFSASSLSASNQIWRERLDANSSREALRIAQVGGVSDALARVMAGRGITLDTMDVFLTPRLRDCLPDPSTLADMDKAASLLADAIQTNKKIAIFGDYDVDGACSAALLAGYLRELNVPYQIHIPDRIFEGYGPNIDAIQMLASNGSHMLVTVDCGSTSFEPLSEAKRLGLQVLVLDHHQVGADLPAVDALVNPNRQDDLSKLGTCCAAGVVFVTLVAVSRELRNRGFFKTRAEPNIMACLDLVALATVADVVPLTGLNRAFVAQGIKIMRQRERIGLRALIDCARLSGPIEPWHLGFLLGPRINAGGRIGDAALGARLLLCDDEAEAQAIAAQLDALNKDRQTVEHIMVQEAIAQVDAKFLTSTQEPQIIVAAQADWHPGIVGLVASRLKERFQRPAFAFAVGQEGQGKEKIGAEGQGAGSGRSIAGVDLGSAVRAAVEAGLLVKGGGHAMAAGATIEADKLVAFEAFMEARLARNVVTASENHALLVDATLTAAGATVELLNDIARAGPFGQGNPEPVFAFASHTLIECMEVGSGGHLRLKFKSNDGASLNGIAFRASGQPIGIALQKSKGKQIHVVGTLNIDRYGGRERVDLRIMDVMVENS
jgi:single-stranded-DNA-specific exonuclease